MTGKIYKIVNDINNKVYVGQTIRTLSARFYKHCSFSDDLNHTMAIKFGICKCSVYNIIKRAKDNTLILESHNPRKSKATIYSKEICDKYNEGYNIQDLIKMFHTSKKYISKTLKGKGIKIQRGRKAKLS